ALLPALEEVRFVGSKHPVAWPSPHASSLRWSIHANGAIHRASAHTHSSCDVRNVGSLLVEGTDRLIRRHALGMPSRACVLCTLLPGLRTVPFTAIHGIPWERFLLGRSRLLG